MIDTTTTRMTVVPRRPNQHEAVTPTPRATHATPPHAPNENSGNKRPTSLIPPRAGAAAAAAGEGNGVNNRPGVRGDAVNVVGRRL
jgi:hypothetical protein